MASSSSDFSTEREAVLRRQQQRKAAPIKFLIPLIYAPALPLIRIALRHNPVVRDRLFYGVLAGAFGHGAYLMVMGLCSRNLNLGTLHNVCNKSSYYEELESMFNKLVRSDLYDAESKYDAKSK